MRKINQRGDEVFDEAILFPSEFNEGELAQAVLALAEHLNLRIVRTNATKHGNTEIQVAAKL